MRYLREAMHARRALLVLILFYVAINPQFPFFAARSQPSSVDFSWNPKFAVVGNTINFTATATGGTPPYSYSWNFSDGQSGTGVWTLHSFAQAGTYAVRVNATDATNGSKSIIHSITIYSWPVVSYNWLIHWNTTTSDGINVWDVSYKGVLLILDARMVSSVVKYRDNLCGPFYDEPTPPETQGVINDGHVYYETNSTAPDPYFQLRAEYRVPGYTYDEVFRFYQSGRWEPEVQIGRGGCATDHIYETRWRIDMAMAGNAGNNFMSTYTPSGYWQDLIWEGSYIDNGFKDAAHNSSQWRIGGGGMLYYLTPTLVRTDLDLPYIPPRIYLVRARANELETAHFCGVVTCEDPVQFVNGELAFRRHIAIWWIPRIWDHGPISAAPAKIATLAFHPTGAWP